MMMDAVPGPPALAAHLQSAALLMAEFHFDSSRQHCLHPTLRLRQQCLLEEAESKLPMWTLERGKGMLKGGEKKEF